MSSASPASMAKAVTPSDTVDLPQGECRALYVGVGGTVVLQGSGNPREDVAFLNVASGTVLPVEAVRVKSTGTTAASIVALY